MMSSNVFKMAAACVVACVCTASASAQSRGEPGPTGACCFPDGECSEETFQECSGLGGLFQGPDTFCADPANRGETGVQCPPPPPPPNDDCENAMALTTSDGFVEGSSAGATEDGIAPCNRGGRDDRGGPRGVWYKVIGTGTELEINLCAETPASSVRGGVGAFVAVFCGGCDNLQCVESRGGGLPPCIFGQRNDVSRGGFLSWCSEEGREYLIFVDFSGPTDNFFIRLRDTGNDKCPSRPCGVEQEDFCRDAQDVCPGITYQGHTFDATSAYFNHGGPIESLFFCGMFFGVYDVWYKYTPADDGLLFVHVEGPPTEYVFGVYDECDEVKGNLLACNIARHHGVIVYPVVAYETYYIRIAGLSFTRGTFELDLVAPLCEGDDNDWATLSE